jgi:hypothetical protein
MRMGLLGHVCAWLLRLALKLSAEIAAIVKLRRSCEGVNFFMIVSCWLGCKG